ncbi:hypothetical protein ACGFOU_17885 [Streptomyces sp. NPDC048595]|uniref:hypothetical protein n=1 Tax=Streptomyces sp. NPDC048595 TaxID=3365576 RepID=UPI00371B8D10
MIENERENECSLESMIDTGGGSMGTPRRVMLTGRKRRAADRHRASGRYPLLGRRVGPTTHDVSRRTTQMNDILTSVIAGIVHIVGWLV